MNISLRQYLALLTSYLKPQRIRVVLLAVLLLSSIGLQLLDPQILRYFIDTAIAGGSLNTLATAALIFLGIALAQQLGAVLAAYISENIGWTATNALRVDLVAHCLRLDLSFHKTRQPGELIERIDGDVMALANFFSRFVVGVFGNLLLLVGVLALLFREDWRVGATIAIFAFLALYSLMRLRARAVPHWMAMREMSAKFFGFLGEHLAATEDIRANGATEYVMRRLYEFFRQWLPIWQKAFLAALSLNVSNRVILGIGTAVVFVLGAYLWGAGAITLGTVYLIFYYTGLLQQPLSQLRNEMQYLQAASASIGRVQELFHTSSKIREGHGAPIPAGALAVRFDHVSFRYEDGEEVLHNIDFQIAPGRVLGLLGRTGSGKTTLARLLLRLYDVTVGGICLGNVPIHAAHLSELRKHVGMVTQEVQLFQANVRDNLTFFDRAISDGEILQVLRELELWTWYQSLPQGLETELEAGGGLSVGEAQLLAFARVFLKSPGLVILDEASAHLDSNTEQLIERAVSQLLRGRTGIIIAHRLTTLQRADEIMILENGRIEEYGARVELMNDPASRFSRLLRVGMDEVLA